MNPLEIIHNLINQNQVSISGNSLRIGQIINGKIIKLFQNQMAEVQIGSQKMIAKLEIPLSAGERYWFKVQSKDGEIILKMISQLEKVNSEEGLLKQIGLSPSKENLQILEFALKEKIPVEKDFIQRASELLTEMKPEKQGMDTIKLMLAKDLPITKEIFTSLLSLHENEPMHQLMEKFLAVLNSKDQTETGYLLQNLIEKEIGILGSQDGQASIDWTNGPLISGELKRIIQTFGFDYEKRVFENGGEKNSENLPLKPLLLRFLNEHPSDNQKHVAEHLLNRITALQIASIENSPIQQFVAEIPLLLGQKSTDLFIQWNGQKKQNGEIDPNYCRVHFYIDLEHIGDTFIDMQIQNRIISISIVNSRNDLKQIAFPLLKSLKEQLIKLDYHLSSVRFSVPSESNRTTPTIPSFLGSTSYEGVDFRV